MSKLFWLSDDQWAAVERHQPTSQAGARRVANFFSGLAIAILVAFWHE